MKNLLIDTDILIDLLAKREAWYNEAALLFELVNNNKVKLNVNALSFANIHYILRRQLKENKVREILRKLKVLVSIVDLNSKILDLALNSNFKDFEDAIQYNSASESNLDCIITRNIKDFKKSDIPVMTAKEYLVAVKLNS